MLYSTYVNPLMAERISEEYFLPELDYYNLGKAAVILRALNHTFRQRIIKTIYYNKTITVTQLSAMLRLEQPLTSLNLAILRKAGIVMVRREGKYSIYSIDISRIKLINETVRNLVEKL
mgnify:CR=1 FL=1